MMVGQPDTAEVNAAILEMRDLLRLLAEPAIAERDKKRREELLRIVGSSKPKAKAVLLMDGSRQQLAIHNEIGINKGDLSTLVKQLNQASLLAGDPKLPKVALTLPSDFFEKAAKA
jgi:hypothetical protein